MKATHSSNRANNIISITFFPRGSHSGDVAEAIGQISRIYSNNIKYTNKFHQLRRAGEEGNQINHD